MIEESTGNPCTLCWLLNKYLFLFTGSKNCSPALWSIILFAFAQDTSSRHETAKYSTNKEWWCEALWFWVYYFIVTHLALQQRELSLFGLLYLGHSSILNLLCTCMCLTVYVQYCLWAHSVIVLNVGWKFCAWGSISSECQKPCDVCWPLESQLHQWAPSR